MKTERNAFEAYFKTVWKGIDLIQTVGEDFAFKLFDGKYVEGIVEEHWNTWQASIQREGYKLVPVEPSEDMIMAGCMEHGGYDVIDSKSIYKAMIEAVEK